MIESTPEFDLRMSLLRAGEVARTVPLDTTRDKVVGQLADFSNLVLAFGPSGVRLVC